MIISLVVAATENNVIGKDNRLLWHLPNDMAFFKNTTWGMPVIMGRRTFESMGKPLKGRTNIVITRKHNSPAMQSAEVLAASGEEEALKLAVDSDARECFVIGGGEIYKMFFARAHKIYMTRVHTTMEGDTFFPAIGQDTWRLSASCNFDADSKHLFPYTFETWERTKNVK